MTREEGLALPSASDDRWVEVSPSQFTHEAEGLEIIRQLLPKTTPFRAWSNFEFRDNHGRWHEVDVLVLGRDALHLVELKYYSGTLRGDDHRWLAAGASGEESPLKLARRKAQYLASSCRTSCGCGRRRRARRSRTFATSCRSSRSRSSSTTRTSRVCSVTRRLKGSTAWMVTRARATCRASRSCCWHRPVASPSARTRTRSSPS